MYCSLDPPVTPPPPHTVKVYLTYTCTWGMEEKDSVADLDPVVFRLIGTVSGNLKQTTELRI
jgi:hypothetical protein